MQVVFVFVLHDCRPWRDGGAMLAVGMSRAAWQRNRLGWVICGAYSFVISNTYFDEIFRPRLKIGAATRMPHNAASLSGQGLLARGSTRELFSARASFGGK
jgi:hypothetical protein